MKIKILLSMIGTMLMSLSSVMAQEVAPAKAITTLAEALDAAMKHDQISPKVDKIRLYSMTTTVSTKRSNYSFTFTDGGSLLHSVSVSEKGKLYYNSRDKGSSRVFKELDITKLPAPKALFIDGMMDKATIALKALKFEPVAGKYYMSYNLSNNYRKKDEAVHRWSVSMPVNDGTSGKTVCFLKGEVSTINNSSIKK